MRFQAPAREAVDPACWTRPPLAALLAAYPWLDAADWPEIEWLNRRFAGRCHTVTGLSLRLVAQTPALLGDGQHYEQRSFVEGRISTRERNWHDLFNALVWLDHGAIKSALNARYVAEMAATAPRQRNRAQMALTHFDEAGAVVWMDRGVAIEAWDAHDWRGLFLDHGEDWRRGHIRISVIGHALLEHALLPRAQTVAKCLVSCGPVPATPAQQDAAECALARAISQGELLNDPQALRPLPLAGIPGWFPGNDRADFFAAECFRPLRPERQYPPPWSARDGDME
ncbi:MAG: DUF3025 domain-containing protein [Lysobacterales bacterium]